MINLNNKTAVVFGGNGILGSNLIKKLLTNNISKIHTTYHKKHDKIDNLKNNYPDKISLIQIDITNDKTVQKFIDGILVRNDIQIEKFNIIMELNSINRKIKTGQILIIQEK